MYLRMNDNTPEGVERTALIESAVIAWLFKSTSANIGDAPAVTILDTDDESVISP